LRKSTCSYQRNCQTHAGYPQYHESSALPESVGKRTDRIGRNGNDQLVQPGQQHPVNDRANTIGNGYWRDIVFR
jgi:hypothetical protein